MGDDEKSQRESQDKELLVHKEEEEGEEVRKGVSRVKISDKDLSTSKENADDSGEDVSDTLEITATIEPIPSKPVDQNSTAFEANMEHVLEQRGRRMSRT